MNFIRSNFVFIFFAIINIFGFIILYGMINYIPEPVLKINDVKVENREAFKNFLSLNAPLEIKFSHELSETIDVNRAFTIYPQVKGQWKWKNAKTALFETEEDWPAGFQGLFEVKQEQKVKPLLVLRPLSVSFKIQEFNLLQWFQNDVGGAGSSEIKVGLEFNAAIDPFLLNKYLSIKDKSNNSLSFSIINKDPVKKLDILIDGAFAEKIIFTIEKDLRPINGKSLNTKIEKTISCSYFFRINYVKPHFNAYQEPYIEVSTNKKESAEALKGCIKITPELVFTLQNSWSGIEIIGAFKGDAEYSILIDKSLSGFSSKNVLVEEFKVKFPHAPIQIDFTDNSLIYGMFGKLNIEMESTNVDKIQGILHQIPIYNYNLFLRSNYRQHIFREEIKTFTKQVPFILNQNSKWSIDLKEVLPKISPGFYDLELSINNEKFQEGNDRYYQENQKKIIVTDLGVSCRKSNGGLFFWINQLSDLNPVNDAEIKLFSKANSLLGELKSDAYGIAQIKLEKTMLDKIEFILVQSGKDATYLKLKENIRSFYGKGSPYTSANYSAFINLERNMFRPGEKMEIDCVIRDRIGEVPPAFPVQVLIKSNDEKSVYSKMEKLDQNGCFHLSYLISEVMAGGRYSISVLLADNTLLGHVKFEIASFYPQRLNGKLDILNKKNPVKVPLEYEIQCEYLTGFSGEGLKVESKVEIFELPKIELENMPGYKIGFSPKNAHHEYIYLKDELLDKDGKMRINYVVPRIENTNALYKISLYSSVIDLGGRKYSLSKDQNYFPQNQFIAIKMTENNTENRKYEIKCIDSNGEILNLNMELDWSLIDIKPRWTLVKNNNYYTYEYSEEGSEISSGKIKTIAGSAELILLNQSISYQELIIKGEGGLKTNLFTQEAQLAKPKSPYIVSFDKLPEASPGEEININVTVPFLGKALICLEADEIQSNQILFFDQLKKSISVKIPETARGSINLSCTILQSQNALGEVKNYRANGTCQIFLNHQNKQLIIKAKPPIKSNSATDISIPCQILDYEGQPVKNARVIVSVMDKGIKNLKGVYAPNPFEFFYGPRSSVIEEFDFYKDIVYEKIQLVEELQPGGGGDDNESSIRQEKFVSFQDRIKMVRWQSEIMITDANGEVACTVPGFEYQGKLDYQIWGLEGNRFGYLNNEILVRDEVVVEESFPKFIYCSDKIWVPIIVQNLEDSEQIINLKITSSSLVSIKDSFENEFNMDAKGRKKIILECNASEEAGLSQIEIVWLVQDKKIRKNINLPVISRKNVSTLIVEGLINNEDKLAITSQELLESNSINAELKITASPFEQLRGSLDYLISYPHGCGEQTVSKLLPLVYSRPLLEMSEKMSSQKEINYYLHEGVNKLQRYQNYHGGIRLWDNAAEPDIFVSAYVSYLFTQLNKSGFKVDNSCVNSLTAFLKNELKENSSLDIKTKCFILYVLALQGEFQKVILNDLVLNIPKLDRTSACFLYMAALLTGMEMKPWLEFSEKSDYYQEIDTSGFYGSYARDLAVELLMASDFDLKINRQALALKLLNLKNEYGHWGSSQSNAWCYFAIMKYLQSFESLEKPAWNCEVWIDDKTHQASNENPLLLKNISSNKIFLRKQGPGPLYYRMVEKGFAIKETMEKISNGLHLNKEILTLKEFEPVDEKKLENGKSYIVKLTIKSDSELDNVVIQEFFPAGLEYSFVEQAEINKKTGKALKLFSTDVKDDRLYLFPEKLESKVDYEYFYSVRATIEGDYFLPACKGEAMYNASLFGQSKSGNIQIRSKNP